METITALILAVAVEAGVPPYFALSVALVENPELDPLAENVNQNGTVDRGIMQLNSCWYEGGWEDPETNIREGCLLLAELIARPELNTYWAVAAAYNCGFTRFTSVWPPPESTIEYANRVMILWHDMDPLGAGSLIGR